ncbi:MAG TPA: hypothetical protein VHK67_07530 [Rhabdochlamydiaceae bacterium]|jgi:hypothetical protein|nr:hypothetical protein [Rhabdochlamydiaceae bacterium]
MVSKVSPDGSVSSPATTDNHQTFIDLKSKLTALHTTKEAPADAADWDWDVTPVTPEHVAVVKELFSQNHKL